MKMELFIPDPCISIVILVLLQAVCADELEIYAQYEGTTCDRIPVENYPFHFIQYHGEIDWSIQACPFGYVFSELECDCVQKDLPAKPTEKKIMAPTQIAPKQIQPRIQIPVANKEMVHTAEPTHSNKMVLINPLQPIHKTSTTITTRTTNKAAFTTTPSTTTKSKAKAKKMVHTAEPTYSNKMVLINPLQPLHKTSTTITTRTTTKATFTTIPSTTTKSKAKAKSLCDGCIFEAGVGYAPHPSACDKYIICYTSLGKSREETRSCPHGKYWDQDVKTCRTSKQVKCIHDKCRELGLKTYRHENRCGEYWECVNSVSIARCCPRGHAYIDRVGCAIDHTCKSRCDEKDEPKQYICDKTEVIGNPHKFKQAINVFGYIDMHCAPGTVYSKELCGCQLAAPEKQTYIKTNSAQCRPELELNFNHGEATDFSRNDVHVQVHNVTFQSGAACFHGNGALVIPRFANADIGKTFVVRMKYRLFNFDETSDIQALLYNGDCGKEPTIVIGANMDGNYFRLKTTNGDYIEITSKKPIDGWRTIEMSLKQGIFSVSIDEQLVESKLLTGSIAKSQCGLKVGWGRSLRAFKGCIDFVSVNTCPL